MVKKKDDETIAYKFDIILIIKIMKQHKKNVMM